MISSNGYSFRIPEQDNLDNCRLCTYDTDPKLPTQWLDYDNGEVSIDAEKQSRYNLQTIGKIAIPKYTSQ